MLMRWIWRGLVYFLARKAWEAFLRHQADQRSPAHPTRAPQPAQPAMPQPAQPRQPIQPTPQERL